MEVARGYEKSALAYNYKDDYVAVNHHGGSTLTPKFNNLVMLSESEIRAYEIQQQDLIIRFRQMGQRRE